MKSEVEETIRVIGEQLNSNIFPLIKNGGVVVSSTLCDSPKFQLEENVNHERQRSRRPSTKSRSRHSRRQGTTSRPWESNRPWTPCDSSQIIGTDIKQKYLNELDELFEAYPDTKVWEEEDGLWILTNSTLINGSNKSATFLICLPFDPTKMPKSWGFWNQFFWIGARHTNFPDGSICAFEPRDGTWIPGNSIIKLLDLYTLWAFRHLYLSEFGKWPGYQVVHYVHERLHELNDDEFCGCSNFDKKYKDCCKQKDLATNYLGEYVKLLLAVGVSERKPPTLVLDFILKGEALPRISELSF